MQKIAAYLAFSLDSSGSDEVRCKSVMPLEEEDKRTYQWAAIDLKGVVIPVTADTLDLSSAEVISGTLIGGMNVSKRVRYDWVR